MPSLTPYCIDVADDRCRTPQALVRRQDVSLVTQWQPWNQGRKQVFKRTHDYSNNQPVIQVIALDTHHLGSDPYSHSKEAKAEKEEQP